jgi:acetyltransferase-like isoleucine patch superfamily enzyme
MIKPVIAFLYYFYNNFVTHIPLYGVRHFYLRNVIRIRLGKKSAVHMGCFFTGRAISIGNNTVINRNCFLDGRKGIEIGNNVSLSPETCLISLSHDPSSPDFSTTGEKVVIEDYVWTGIRAMILPGVRLGRGCVAGAGAVVTKSQEDFSIVAGSPAKKIGRRNPDLRYDPSYFPFFNTDILAGK